MDMLMNNHLLHAAVIGGVVYVLTKKPAWASVATVGSYGYMQFFGMGVPLPSSSPAANPQDERQPDKQVEIARAAESVIKPNDRITTPINPFSPMDLFQF